LGGAGVNDNTKAYLWALFEERICERRTKEFLLTPELVSLVAPMMMQFVEEEERSLRARLTDVSLPEETAAIIAQRPRIALTNCHLANFAGSELWTHDIARYFTRIGLPTMVWSPVIGRIAELIEQSGVRVTSDPAEIASFEPESIQVNHHAIAAPVLAQLPQRTAIVNTVHGLLPRAELPGVQGVDLYCAVALHAKASICLLVNAHWRSIHMTPSFYDKERFRNVRNHDGKKRALLFSSKTTPEEREPLSRILAQAGYTLDHTGYGGIPNGAPEEILPQYDLVFAVARSAVEALASGCRVILWDAGLVGPMVTADNFWRCAVSNFSLLGCVLPWRTITHVSADSWLLGQLEYNILASAACDLTRTYLSLDRVGPLLIAAHGRAMAARRQANG
jgi:hypothetical protein